MTEVSTLRVHRKVKEEFDRLQGLVQAEGGARVSQSELLDRVLLLARRHEHELIEPMEERLRRRREALRRLSERIEDWGVETDSSKIDEVLYGDEVT